jgi:hypothetical protein
MNTCYMSESFAALRDLIEALNTPGCTDIAQKVDNYIEASNKFMRSQPGFETFPKSKKLRKDPRNKAFFDLYDSISAGMEFIKSNPQSASTFFNSEAAASFGRFTILMSEVVIPECSSESE